MNHGKDASIFIGGCEPRLMTYYSFSCIVPIYAEH